MENIITSDGYRFLKNAWYVAALSEEIVGEELFARTILSESVLFYRTLEGKPVAMSNRCPHRFAPLNIGKREGDTVTCHYHGLTFDAQGECTNNPHGNGKIPQACKLNTYAVEERDGFIWIWMGEQDKADPSKIMDCSCLTRNPDSAVAHTYMHNKCNYELVTDNIMDLSHIDHLHGPLINTNGKLSPLLPKVSEAGDNITVRWDWLADPAMLLFAQNLARPEDTANQFFEVVWHAPSNMQLTVGAVQDAEDYHQDGLVLYDFHIMTPESATTTHYFFASTRNYMMDDAAYNKAKMDGMIEAFTLEDKPVIEAQQREMGGIDLLGLNPVLLSSDAGGIRVRRKLRSMIEAESA
ncbi:aromatic ring-hydroxylating dioxygenase subunit alpha [Neptuniibacter sp. CAU 1671]|uniref:aromatic ring-hydroxylating dioxygenase subunit alpha n=1 Tax=Neptuniibacter sp. CAU 1671 TaxID=3032593 RepID=UPI0023D9B3D3|nr:aromatic ring-hydroxylating dioxygenase subunit alpha [Neptuniibacter sp. CAU 1671]MDF2180531.1 aromatic ring-hydroxylating dioxygenase subunit alpha [Neptuniibacter sp. CAU 1671]